MPANMEIGKGKGGGERLRGKGKGTWKGKEWNKFINESFLDYYAC